MTLATVPRYNSKQLSDIGTHAVVVGGSIAGLCAAQVLVDGFERVTIIERDRLRNEPVARTGAPQTSHPHTMLEAGRATLEDLFPGFGEELLSAGGLMIDAATELKYYEQGDYLAAGPDRLSMCCASRPLFEYLLSQRITARNDVHLRDNSQVTDYLLDDDGEVVTGVTIRTEDGQEAELAADLVVDASGRTSRTPSWLENHGYPVPSVDEVHVDVTYGTIRVERPPDDRRVLFVPPESPRTRGGMAVPIENDCWEVVLQGVHGDAPPAERDGFVAFAESLPVPALGQLVKGRSWISDKIQQDPFPSNIWRRYDQLDRFPDGLIVTGDAIASFNPIYGQGMSVAALDALLLHHTLAESGLDSLAPRFFKRTADLVDIVWKLAVGKDFEFPQTTGPKPLGIDLFNRYISYLIRQAHDDGVLTEAFYRVIRLEQSATRLLRPNIMWRVLRPSEQISCRLSDLRQFTADASEKWHSSSRT